MQAKNEMEAIKALNEKVAGIVESGSNENGSWVKFADGTMICYGNSYNQENGRAVANYPVSFIENPTQAQTTISYNSYTSSHLVYTVPSLAKEFAYIYCRKADGSIETNTTVKINWLIIGKWK